MSGCLGKTNLVVVPAKKFSGAKMPASADGSFLFDVRHPTFNVHRMKFHQIDSVAACANVPWPVRKKSFRAWIMLALLLTLCAARADGPDDDYLNIYGIIEQADALNASGKTSQAHAKYVEAARALMQFQRDNPTWNTRTVSYRLTYLTDKAAATSPKVVAPENTGSTTAQETASAPKSLVTLLDAGSEPRTVLRLHPAIGDRQTISMTMKSATTTSMAGKDTSSMSMPPILMTMDVNVKDISADGEITYDMTVGDVTVAGDDTNAAPGMAAVMKSSLVGIQGMTGTGRISDRGIIKDLQMKLPAGTNPQLAQTLDQMKESVSGSSTPLPDEAVGPGAKWEYQTRVISQGMTIDQTATYELVSLEDNRLTLRNTITQNAASQTIQNPAMPGLKMNLNKMTGNGDGTTTYDLAHIMPVAGALDEKTEVVMSLNIGQQKQNMEVKMDMSFIFEAK
jgi:hypothetical protein